MPTYADRKIFPPFTADCKTAIDLILPRVFYNQKSSVSSLAYLNKHVYSRHLLPPPSPRGRLCRR